MAKSTIFGLEETDPKKKFTLQAAQSTAPVGDDSSSSLTAPTTPFSNLPLIQSVAQNIIGSQPGANLPANFKFTGAYENRNRGLQQEESDAGFRRRNTLADIDEQYQTTQRKSADLRNIAYKQLVENMASRGLGASGIHAQEQGKLETNYTDYLNDLATSRARGITGVENDYSSILNEISRRREGLFGEQQKGEEDRKLREEQAKAAAEAQRVQAEQQAAMLQEIAKAQESARSAAQAASAARALPSYSAPSIGGGGGYYQQPQQEQQAAPQSNLIVLPPFGQGVQQSQVKSWIVNNVDRNLAGNAPALDAVMNALIKNPNGMTTEQISAVINNTGYGQGAL